MGEEFKSFYLTFVAALPARNLQFEEENAEQDLRRFRKATTRMRMTSRKKCNNRQMDLWRIATERPTYVRAIQLRLSRRVVTKMMWPTFTSFKMNGNARDDEERKKFKNTRKKKQIKLDGGRKSRAAASSAIVSFLVTVIRDPRLEF